MDRKIPRNKKADFGFMQYRVRVLPLQCPVPWFLTGNMRVCPAIIGIRFCRLPHCAVDEVV